VVVAAVVVVVVVDVVVVLDVDVVSMTVTVEQAPATKATTIVIPSALRTSNLHQDLVAIARGIGIRHLVHAQPTNLPRIGEAGELTSYLPSTLSP
jgi:hypothetical protein